MTKAKKIRIHCLSCAGDSPKDVAFCTDPKCIFFEDRLGVSLESTTGIEMMTNYCRKYPKDFKELEGYGVDPSLYLPQASRRIGRKVLNQGLLAFKSRQKELAMDGSRGGDFPARPDQKIIEKGKNDEN